MKDIIKRRIFRHRFTIHIFGNRHFFLLDIVTDILCHIKQKEDQSEKGGVDLIFSNKVYKFKKNVCCGTHCLNL